MRYDEVRARLYSHIVSSEDDPEGVFREALNQALESLHTEGMWDGTTTRTDIKPYITSNILTLPYAYDTMVAVAVEDSPVGIVNQSLEFQQNGPGVIDAGEGGVMVVDMGFVNESDQSVRKYKFPMDVTNFTVEAILKARHVQIIANDDLVIPSNVRALKCAILAVNYENRGDMKSSEIYWAKAYAILDAEKSMNKIGSVTPPPQNQWGILGEKVNNLF